MKNLNINKSDIANTCITDLTFSIGVAYRSRSLWSGSNLRQNLPG